MLSVDVVQRRKSESPTYMLLRSRLFHRLRRRLALLVDTLENVVIVLEHLGKMLFAPRLVADHDTRQSKLLPLCHVTRQSKLLPLCLHKGLPVRAFGLIRELLGGLLTTALPTIHETLQQPRVSLAGLIRKSPLCAPGSDVPALAPIENAVQ